MSQHWEQHVVAVTGTIGSGKSTFVRMLAELGVHTESADVLAREVVRKGSEGLAAVVTEFGNDILTPDGELNRKKLGSIVFADSAQRHKLEALTHPRIAALAGERFAPFIEQAESPLVYEIPLLFENAFHKRGFKLNVLVAADDNVCKQRIMQRDSLSEEEATRRLSVQLPVEQKRKLADVVIDNSGTPEQLREQARRFLDSLKR